LQTSDDISQRSGSPSPSASAAATGLTKIRTMAGSSDCGTPSQLSFSSGGGELAGAGGSGIACVWTVSSGKLTYKATDYHDVYGAQFDPHDGELTYATSGGVPINVGKVGASGGITNSLSNGTHMKSGLEAVAVSPSRSAIAVSYRGGATVQFYDMGIHRWIADTDSGTSGSHGTLTFSPDGNRLAHAEPGGVSVLDTSSLSGAKRTWHGPGAAAAAFLTNGTLLTCSGSTVSAFDVSSHATAAAHTATISGHCAGIAVAPDGHTIAVSTTDQGIVLLTLPHDWS